MVVGFGAAIAQTDEQRGDEKTHISAGINRENDTECVSKEGEDHDLLGADTRIEYPAKDHGYGETYKPHLVYKAELCSAESESFSQLRKNSRAYTK